MAICPATLKGCIDDICYGSGCLRLRGDVPLLVPCNGCGRLVGIDGTENDDCECGPDEWWDDDISAESEDES